MAEGGQSLHPSGRACAAQPPGSADRDESGVDGLGPGLFIAKYAADLLGHRVRVRSAEGIGSTFAIITNAVPDTARAV